MQAASKKSYTVLINKTDKEKSKSTNAVTIQESLFLQLYSFPNIIYAQFLMDKFLHHNSKKKMDYRFGILLHYGFIYRKEQEEHLATLHFFFQENGPSIDCSFLINGLHLRSFS